MRGDDVGDHAANKAEGLRVFLATLEQFAYAGVDAFQLPVEVEEDLRIGYFSQFSELSDEDTILDESCGGTDCDDTNDAIYPGATDWVG